MLPKVKTNFAARFEYLKAIEKQWPNVLRDLISEAFPVYQTYWQSNTQGSALQTLAYLTAAVRDAPSPELVAFDQALRKWAHAYGCQDAWIWDAAVQTMYRWVQGGKVGKWGYFPEELDTPKFEPKFGRWIPLKGKWPAGWPDGEWVAAEWADFKKVTDAIYRRDLAKYRAEVRKKWGEGHKSLSETAVWTVLWQQGKSPEAISHRHFKTTGKKLSYAAIQKGVHAFAESAGVTLRKPKAGSGAKQI